MTLQRPKSDLEIVREIFGEDPRNAFERVRLDFALNFFKFVYRDARGISAFCKLIGAYEEKYRELALTVSQLGVRE